MSHVFKKAMQLLIGTEEPMLETSPAAPAAKTQKPAKKPTRPLKKLTERELIQLESEVGALLFGEIPVGHRREFFNLDPNTWIWYDESIEPKARRQRHSVTVRYEIHDNGILKVQEGARYTFLEGDELKNFVMATQLYYERVCRQVYQRQPHPALVGSHA
ncbi:MAG: hypothetical protein ACTJG2_02440 [Candidatus Saccharimonadales bacterium]